MLNTVGLLMADDSIQDRDDDIRSDIGSKVSIPSARSRRHRPPPSVPGLPANMSKQEHEAQQRRNEHMVRHRRLLDQRKEDERFIKEKVSRNEAEREKRFVDIMEDIEQKDVLRVQAAQIINDSEMEEDRRRNCLYNEWDSKVCQRIEYQLHKYMSRNKAEPPAGIEKRDYLIASDDPIKKSLLEERKEESFRRAADAIIGGNSRLELGEKGLLERIQARERAAEAVSARERSRPILEPTKWGQRLHYASPYGYFAQGCEAGTGFHTARRQGPGAHRPDERDGVPTAGKVRTRDEGEIKYSQLDHLHGESQWLGDSYEHKQAWGAGSAAPNQDHFTYSHNQESVALEFPLGKKIFTSMHM